MVGIFRPETLESPRNYMWSVLTPDQIDQINNGLSLFNLISSQTENLKSFGLDSFDCPWTLEHQRRDLNSVGLYFNDIGAEMSLREGMGESRKGLVERSLDPEIKNDIPPIDQTGLVRTIFAEEDIKVYQSNKSEELEFSSQPRLHMAFLKTKPNQGKIKSYIVYIYSDGKKSEILTYTTEHKNGNLEIESNIKSIKKAKANLACNGVIINTVLKSLEKYATASPTERYTTKNKVELRQKFIGAISEQNQRLQTLCSDLGHPKLLDENEINYDFIPKDVELDVMEDIESRSSFQMYINLADIPKERRLLNTISQDGDISANEKLDRKNSLLYLIFCDCRRLQCWVYDFYKGYDHSVGYIKEQRDRMSELADKVFEVFSTEGAYSNIIQANATNGLYELSLKSGAKTTDYQKLLVGIVNIFFDSYSKIIDSIDEIIEEQI